MAIENVAWRPPIYAVCNQVALQLPLGLPSALHTTTTRVVESLLKHKAVPKCAGLDIATSNQDWHHSHQVIE
jgi:hypothetical protein